MQSNLETSRLRLTDEQGLGRITVDMQAFFEFSFWMAEELQDLIGREQLRHPPKPRQRRDKPRRLRP